MTTKEIGLPKSDSWLANANPKVLEALKTTQTQATAYQVLGIFLMLTAVIGGICLLKYLDSSLLKGHKFEVIVAGSIYTGIAGCAAWLHGVRLDTKAWVDSGYYTSHKCAQLLKYAKENR